MCLFCCFVLLFLLVVFVVFVGGFYQVELVVFCQVGDVVLFSQLVLDDWVIGVQLLVSDVLCVIVFDNQFVKFSQDNGYIVLLYKVWCQDIGEILVKIVFSEGQEQDYYFLVEGMLIFSQVCFVDMEVDFWVNCFGDDGFFVGSQYIRQGMWLKNGELIYFDYLSLGILIKVVLVGVCFVVFNFMEMEEQQVLVDVFFVEGGFDVVFFV